MTAFYKSISRILLLFQINEKDSIIYLFLTLLSRYIDLPSELSEQLNQFEKRTGLGLFGLSTHKVL